MKIVVLLTFTFRQVLEELVTEGSGEVLTSLARKLRGEKEEEEVRHVVGEEGEEYRLEPTGKLGVPRMKHSESAPNILVSEIMPQDGLKSILRPPGSPRNGLKRARTTSIPTEVSLCGEMQCCSLSFMKPLVNVKSHESLVINYLIMAVWQVWEIENCLAEREEDAWRQLEEESCMGR